MAEWSIAAVLKTVELRGSGGSNPSLSAQSPVNRKIYRTFSFNFLCSMYENDFLSVESGFLKFLSKTCWLFVRNFLILP